MIKHNRGTRVVRTSSSVYTRGLDHACDWSNPRGEVIVIKTTKLHYQRGIVMDELPHHDRLLVISRGKLEEHHWKSLEILQHSYLFLKEKYELISVKIILIGESNNTLYFFIRSTQKS